MKEHREWYTQRIESLEELEELLKQLDNHCRNSPVKPLYRGQADAEWMIVSKFYRDFGYKFDLPSLYNFEELSEYLDSEREEEPYLQYHNLLALEFMKICWHELDIKVTHPEAPALPDFNFYLALAQHYDLPTNLVDFTWSPYIGLFFAFDYSDEQSFESEYVALYQSHPHYWRTEINKMVCRRTHDYEACMTKWDKLSSEFTFASNSLTVPRLSTHSYEYNTRMRNQRGTFFFSKDAVPYDVLMYRMKSGFHYLENLEKRILINRSLKGAVKARIFDKLNINKATIYPSEKIDKMHQELKGVSKRVLESV